MLERTVAIEDQVGGLPSFKMDSMRGVNIPGDWEIQGVLGDIIMAQYADENSEGEVLRDGIYITTEMVTKMWRVAKVIRVGPKCRTIKIDDFIMFPSDKGIPMINFKKQKLIFLNEERVFAIVKKPENT